MVTVAWSAPSGHSWVTGEVVTAANLNTYVRLNLEDLDRRTTLTGAIVAATENTTATVYSDLATVGPAVTVTVGAAGKALVSLYSALSNGSGNFALMSYATSGSTTTAAQDDWSLQTNNTSDIRMGATVLYLGGAGSTTFATKYRATGGTASFNGRRLLVTPLGS